MRKLILLLFTVIGLPVLCLAAFIYARDVFYVVDSFRYRLTVNFVVDGKPLSANGVVQETVHRPPCILGETNCGHTSIKGDAIPITFPNGKLAFILLEVVDGKRATTGDYPSAALPRPSPTKDRSGWVNQEFDVSPQLLPNIVYFSDPIDPYTAALIDPQEIDKVGGPAAAYVNATVAVTSDPVTRSIDHFLPWIANFKSDPHAGKGDYFRQALLENLSSYLRRDDL